MQYEKNIIPIGDSVGIILPKDLCSYLKLDIGSTVILQDDKSKKGVFVSFWKKE